MNPPIFQTCTASPAVTALLGQLPTRLFLFGHAPKGVQLPYAVWQTAGGLPENYMSGPPDIDSWILQIDVYAASASSARQVAVALRDAIEPHAHVVRWGGDDRDPETKNFSFSFDVSWWVKR